MEKFVRVWISSSVQPILLVVDANHCFVNRNLIRDLATGRTVDRFSAPSHALPSESVGHPTHQEQRWYSYWYAK
jgi:hypothetical protein